jgi:hypothetical protein
MANDDQDVNWTAVIARCLAHFCLKNSEYCDKSVLEQARFLEKLGLPRDDRAAIVGSSAESLRVMACLARKKKDGKKNGKGNRS